MIFMNVDDAIELLLPLLSYSGMLEIYSQLLGLGFEDNGQLRFIVKDLADGTTLEELARFY